MPIYSLQCKKCGNMQDEVLGMFELNGTDSENLDLAKLNIKCKRCHRTRFVKKLAPHAKMASNWSR